MADAEFSIYLPYYTALITDVHDGYDSDALPKLDPKTWKYVIDDAFMESVKDSINWNFQLINYYCYNNRQACADSVKAFFETWQKDIIKAQSSIDAQMLEVYAYDKALAKEKATALGTDLAQQTLEMTNKVLAELKAYVNSGSTEGFALSEEVKAMTVDYSFDNVGGTGLPAGDDNNNNNNNNNNNDNAQQKPSGTTTNGGSNDGSNVGSNDGTKDQNVPSTGDNANAEMMITILALSAASTVLLKKKLQK